MTLWQMLCNKIDTWFNPVVTVPTKELYNPLQLTNGLTLTIDVLEYRKYTFVVTEVLNYELYDNYTFADYVCRSTLTDEDPFIVRVRVYPHDMPGRDLQILVLKQYDVLDYDEDFKVLLDDQQFNTMIDEKIEASFWRINDVKTPYKAKNGIWYWDYWRETKDEGNSIYKEFLFVELDKNDTGRFTIWRGEEVTRSRICV